MIKEVRLISQIYKSCESKHYMSKRFSIQRFVYLMIRFLVLKYPVLCCE